MMIDDPPAGGRIRSHLLLKAGPQLGYQKPHQAKSQIYPLREIEIPSVLGKLFKSIIAVSIALVPSQWKSGRLEKKKKSKEWEKYM